MPNSDDKNDNKIDKPEKKGKTIQPLDEDEIREHLANTYKLHGTDESVLSELAARAAEIAEQVSGKEEAQAKVLELTDLEDSEKTLLEPINESGVDKNYSANSAVEMIRSKLSSLYKTEPDATTQAAESVAITTRRTKHQQKMYDITTSGKSLAEIQTEWHNYYVKLPNTEKHDVWQEFYQNQSKVSKLAEQSIEPKPKSAIETSNKILPRQKKEQSAAEIKSKILRSVSAGGQLKPIHHLKSLFFGLGLSGFVMLIIVFTFFNQVFVAPLISPSQSVSATPILGDLNGPVDPEPKIIIPKINLEVPVVFDLTTTDEAVIQTGLERGVVHYSSTPDPGQNGNSVIVGHSSNNILNSGKYKFAFVLLRRLEIGDVFYVNKDSVRYSYKIYDKKVVAPDDVSVLGDAERDNSMTLITCDPPGTSRNRLIIIAEQIAPDPSGNTAAAPETDQSLNTIEELPSNAPSLWSRFWPF